MATNSHALRASRLSGTREAGEAEARRWFARLEHPRSARCLTRRICLETNENRRVRFESPPSHQHRGRDTAKTMDDDELAVWQSAGGVLRAHQPEAARGAGCLRFRLEAVVLFSSRRPRSVVLFLQVEKCGAVISPPFGARSNVAPPNDALALTKPPILQSYTTSARSRPTGTARAGRDPLARREPPADFGERGEEEEDARRGQTLEFSSRFCGPLTPLFGGKGEVADLRARHRDAQPLPPTATAMAAVTRPAVTDRRVLLGDDSATVPTRTGATGEREGRRRDRRYRLGPRRGVDVTPSFRFRERTVTIRSGTQKAKRAKSSRRRAPTRSARRRAGASPRAR